MFMRDDDVLPIELLKAVERFYSVLVVVGNGDLHVFSLKRSASRCNTFPDESKNECSISNSLLCHHESCSLKNDVWCHACIVLPEDEKCQ